MGDPADRREDWAHGVDENLASLNAGQRVWEHEQKALRKLLREIDDDLRGSIGKETDGMIGRLRAAETRINLLLSVIDIDRAGNKGLIGRVDDLERGETRSDRRLKIWIACIGLLSATLVAALSNVERIERFLNKGKPDPVHQAIERSKRPRRRHVIIRKVPLEPEAESESGDAVP